MIKVVKKKTETMANQMWLTPMKWVTVEPPEVLPPLVFNICVNPPLSRKTRQ